MATIYNSVDVQFKWLISKIRENVYTLHNEEDPLFRMLIERELHKQNIPITYEQGNMYMKLAKSIVQYEGDFWQRLFGDAPGWRNLQTGHITKCDILHEERNIIIELKNKYNTMNSDSKNRVLEKLENASRKYNYSPVLGIIHDKTEQGAVKQLKGSITQVSGAELFKTVYETHNARDCVFERLAALCDDTERVARYMTRRIIGNIIYEEKQQANSEDISKMIQNIIL